MSLSDFLGTVQALATVVAVYFAWRAVQEARAARREAAREQHLARLERIRAMVTELDRLLHMHVEDRVVSVQSQRLAALLQSFGPAELLETRAYLQFAPFSPWSDSDRELPLDSVLAELDLAADDALADTKPVTAGSP